MKHLSRKVRVAIDKQNPSIFREEKLCIKCGECARVCSKIESVNNNYHLTKASEPICVNCGQCVKVCPTCSLKVKEDYQKVQQEIKNGKIVIVSTSPAVRVALGDCFNMNRGSFVQGKMIALLRKLGFKYVLDTNFGADLTIIEEATELLNRIKKGENLPQFTSCCPAWVKFVETFYPEYIKNISTCKSPISMQGAVIKTYFASKMGIEPENIVTVSLTPCTAKKYEIARQEFCSASTYNRMPMRDNDYVITTTELATWARQEKIDFELLNDEKFDTLLGECSGGGIIFGNSGGVMQSALRTAYFLHTNNNPSNEIVIIKQIQGLDGIKEAVIDFDGLKIKVACVQGLANARNLFKRIKNGEKFDFIEVMACVGGCVGGGGQPIYMGDEKNTRKARIDSLYEKDKKAKIRFAHENKEIKELYSQFLKTPNSELSQMLLHTSYSDKSKMLGEDVFAKYQGTKTYDNLQLLISDKDYNYDIKMLEKFIKIAEDENLADIVETLKMIVDVQVKHNEKIKSIFDDLK